jgi:formylglycine-generating enzyme required for sulfatase activity
MVDAAGLPMDRRPGVSIVVRDGIKLPDIEWGGIVPAGMYVVGEGSETGEIELPLAYQLARYPVTYAQFQCFIDANDFGNDVWWDGMPLEEEAYGTVYKLRELSDQAFPYWNHPREGVSWYQAVAFCRWLSDKLGETVDLPTEFEWEVAARFPHGSRYPWGEAFDVTLANTGEGESVNTTTAVGMYPRGINTALALYDLSGNVWEWCRNKYDQPDEVQVDESGATRSLRGGSWCDFSSFARVASRSRGLPHARYSSDGFRLVLRRPPSHVP